MSSLRTLAGWSTLAVVLLVSPALTLLAVIADEALVDLASEVGVPTILSLVAAGALGRALFRRMSARWKGAEHAGSEEVLETPPVAAQTG